MPSVFLGDVELGKKDDDRNKHGGGGGNFLLWLPRRMQLQLQQPRAVLRVHPRKLLKRLLIVFVVGLVAYVFVHNLPGDVPVRDHRRPVYYPNRQRPQRPHVPPAAPPGQGDAASAAAGAVAALPPTYDGPVRLLSLAASLRSVAHTRGGHPVNKNVLFAAADVQSIAALLPLACQMGARQRSYVHFAVMGRSTLSIEELQAINGVDASCRLLFHDARPEYAFISTDARLQSSVELAMTHIQAYIHPQAIVADGSLAEDAFLQDGLQAYTRGSQTPLIELPRHAARRVGWLTELDSASLAHWNAVRVDVLVHAHPGASGSLIRLLKSLAAADYGGGAVPHLTIELPQAVDGPTAAFLETFQWPPSSSASPQLALRHRIPQHSVGEEESAARFLEAFWPTSPQHAHVLVLSPQAELSPDYFHYLKFTLLEYRYSNAAAQQGWARRLFGLSLALPSVGLDGTTPLVPPLQTPGASTAGSDTSAADLTSSSSLSSFLWQAPNSHAMLFLGERWVELHRFVAQLLASQARHPERAEAVQKKAVSKHFPAWLELALQLCRARGLWTLYPSAPTARVLAAVHRELDQPPEEYAGDGDETIQLPVDDDDDQMHLGATHWMETLQAQAQARRQQPVGKQLDDDGDDDDSTGDRVSPLPPFTELPLLAWEGSTATAAAVDKQTQAFANAFRRTAGGCSEGMLAVLLPETLFCDGDG